MTEKSIKVERQTQNTNIPTTKRHILEIMHSLLKVHWQHYYTEMPMERRTEVLMKLCNKYVRVKPATQHAISHNPEFFQHFLEIALI